jgi:glycerone phosphate O-acyltransferase/fatty acyl-CoA reductase
VLEPAISPRADYSNLLTLGLYRNRIAHLFFLEALWACALYTHRPEANSAEEAGVPRSALRPNVQFLFDMLRGEFVWREDGDANRGEDHDRVLAGMVSKGTLTLSGNVVEVAEAGEQLYSLLCAILLPFVDSYFACALVLFSLQPSRVMEKGDFLERAQGLATTLYHDSRICFFEACSSDTLGNALKMFQAWGVVSIDKGVVQLTEKYQVHRHT